ncbi:MAG: aryl-sulfate sulfotransferase, partial [Candidatus Kapaibacterium sp.]
MRKFFSYCSLLSLDLLLSAGATPQTGKNAISVTYSYPAQNSTEVNAKTAIGIRYGEQLSASSIEPSAFSVVGALSGKHSGKVTLALDKRTVIFTPDNNFIAAEKVQVKVNPLRSVSGANTASYTLTFQIAKQKNLPLPLGMRQPEIREPEGGNKIIGIDTIFDDFPLIHITKNNKAAPGNLYLGNLTFNNNDSSAYLIILDSSGNPLFRRRLWAGFTQDFKPQPNGMYTYFDANLWNFKFYGLDSNYNLIDSFEAANAEITDSHELIFLPTGGYALLAQADDNVDMSKIVSGGDTNTLVEEGIIQEFDAAKNLIFEWRARDHFAFTDPTYENLTWPVLDFTHCNAIANDGDTAFLLSSRHLDEVTKINREDGHIIWRWGGKHNEFTFVDDSLTFSHQHAVRKLPNGNIIMFDNGTFHKTPLPFSRAVEYKLDEKAKIATKVWEYHHNPDVYGSSMGYVQQLANGNRLICWGACDSAAVTEIT